MPSKLPWDRLKAAVVGGGTSDPLKMSPPPTTLRGEDLTAISKKLGPTAYGAVTKARAGYGPNLGLSSSQLAQVDRYLEGSSVREGDPVEKAMGLAKAGGYEVAKGLAQHLPNGRKIWNSTIGRFSDFAMDGTTSPASLGNVSAYAHGALGAAPEEEAAPTVPPPSSFGVLRR